jgi:hypothetical protein
VTPQRPLTRANPETTTILTLYPQYVRHWPSDPPHLLGHYWGPANGRTGRDGQVSGPGFRVDAKDFPPGTRLTVTARLELPDSEPADPAAEEWQHGDVVLDDRGLIWTRAHPLHQEQGWPWAFGADTTLAYGTPYASEGGHPEHAPARPLTLLVRNGKAVQVNKAPAPQQTGTGCKPDDHTKPPTVNGEVL